MTRQTENPTRYALAFCGEKKRLQDDFLAATRNLNALLNQQMLAVIEGDSDFARFDVLLHIAQERKEMAKYAWIGHVDSHHCEEA
jgi:hypothetical protein